MKFGGLMPSNDLEEFSNIGAKSTSSFNLNILGGDRFGEELEIEDVNIDLGDDNDSNPNRKISLDSDEQNKIQESLKNFDFFQTDDILKETKHIIN